MKSYVYHFKRMSKDNTIEVYNVVVVQRLHDCNFLEELSHHVVLSARSTPQGFHCYRQLKKRET